MLAAKTILAQGIEVVGLNFFTGFCHSGHTSAIRGSNKHSKPKRNDALWSAEQLGIKLQIVDIVEEYKTVLTQPKHGYGQHLNPCLDCKIFMVKRAMQWLQEHDFDFIITGEVIGQRPMSQRRDTMPVISNQSGAEDRLLRPLCALRLPPTLPEREGWVDRSKLYGFTGRSRKPQIALAQEFALQEYAQPAGGCCVLTDLNYTRKLKDFWQTRASRAYELDDIILLKVGRHLRPTPSMKLIIGREEGENNFLEGYRKQYTHLRITSHTGPLVLIDGEPSDDDLLLAAQITGRFSSGREADQVTIELHCVGGASKTLQVKPMRVADVDEAWYL